MMKILRVKGNCLQAEEEISYTVYYAVAEFYDAGVQPLTTRSWKKWITKPVLPWLQVWENKSLHMIGSTKLGTEYETFIDTATCSLWNFLRNVK